MSVKCASLLDVAAKNRRDDGSGKVLGHNRRDIPERLRNVLMNFRQMSRHDTISEFICFRQMAPGMSQHLQQGQELRHENISWLSEAI